MPISEIDGSLEEFRSQVPDLTHDRWRPLRLAGAGQGGGRPEVSQAAGQVGLDQYVATVEISEIITGVITNNSVGADFVLPMGHSWFASSVAVDHSVKVGQTLADGSHHPPQSCPG